MNKSINVSCVLSLLSTGVNDPVPKFKEKWPLTLQGRAGRTESAVTTSSLVSIMSSPVYRISWQPQECQTWLDFLLYNVPNTRSFWSLLFTTDNGNKSILHWINFTRLIPDQHYFYNKLFGENTLGDKLDGQDQGFYVLGAQVYVGADETVVTMYETFKSPGRVVALCSKY